MARLVLTRRIGESIRIGDDIVVRIADSRADGSCRVVIEAPRTVPIVREELLGGRRNAAAVHGRDRR